MSEKRLYNPRVISNDIPGCHSDITLKDIIALIWVAKGNGISEGYDLAEQFLKEREKRNNA